MRRHELEHVLRAAKGITDEIEFVVIGSQAILARIPDPPMGANSSKAAPSRTSSPMKRKIRN
jgi:hypothetical protein